MTRPILITGRTGSLGYAFARMCDLRGLAYVATSRAELEISNERSAHSAIELLNPWAVINTAGYVRVDEAEVEQEECLRANVTGVRVLSRVCRERDLPFLTFSSDLVFGGEKSSPYVESDSVRPMNVYGRSKAAAELVALEEHPSALVVRTAAFFGPWDAHNFLAKSLGRLAAGEELPVADDVVSPTYLPDLVDACLDLLQDDEQGVWHLTNATPVAWVDFAREAARRAGLAPTPIRRTPRDELRVLARRPRYTALRSERCQLLPELDSALTRYFEQWSLQGA